MRTLSTLLAASATAVALSAAAPAALAAPDTGSSSGSSSPGCGPRSTADLHFLRGSHEDEHTCSVQDAAIGLAKSQCQWLDAYGNSAHNQIVLAEKARGTLKYPYTFLDAAISAYCPQYKL
ncbi:DUF732 domain-containing protein [Nocardia aurantiaca]|uniref:DUF732 domain-containing protein n=1 Tax=Nocardia aurantiaca TaxID=2675850 RepID=A0A6I3KWU9_9NOCA|nr:DUF732 domain-containing protein [Nocardia aurantiaca]MTE14137.1 DUF732 domain-containing protein [Nocardia aurantiaca]